MSRPTSGWHDLTARTLLKHAAQRAIHLRRWETAARLYDDAYFARGIVSRVAFKRSLRASKMPPEEIEGWLAECDAAQRRFDAEVESYAATLPKPRSPIDRMIDEACGVPRLGSKS